jgi:hypothetical protein
MHRGCIGKSPGGDPPDGSVTPRPPRCHRSCASAGRPSRRTTTLCFPLSNDFFAILSPAIATAGICDSEEKLLKLRLINNDTDSRHIRRRTYLFAWTQRSHPQVADHLRAPAKSYVRLLYAHALAGEVPGEGPAEAGGVPDDGLGVAVRRPSTRHGSYPPNPRPGRGLQRQSVQIFGQCCETWQAMCPHRK